MKRDSGKIYYGLALDNSALKTGAAEARVTLTDIGNTAQKEGDRIDESFRKIGQAAAGMFAAAQIKDFISQVAKVRGEFQQLEIAFETMLGSKAQADALMSQLIKTAATTPFQMNDIATSAKQLLAYGLEADKVNDTLIRLGDIAAGLSVPINDLAFLYGTTMVQGRLYTQDLNQFLGRGIPLMGELAKQFGVAESEVKKLVEEGKVGFPEVQKAIENLTNEGSKFGGLMAAQSQTITGQISNLEDQIEQIFNTIGKANEGIISDAIGLASQIVEHWEEIGKVLLTVIATYGAYKGAVLAVAAAHKLMAIWGAVQAFLSLIPAVKSAKDAMILFNLACKANPIGLVLSTVAAAVTAFALFGKSSNEAAEALKRQQQEAEEFQRSISESAGKAQSEYKALQKEYEACKTAHEKRQWIKESQSRFKDLGISVSSVNTAENIFVKNTQLMMEAFKKRAEAAAWQSKVEEEYAKRVERQLVLEEERKKLQAGSEVRGKTYHSTASGDEYVDRSGYWVYTEQGAKKAREALSDKNDPIMKAIDERINSYTERVSSLSDEMTKLFKESGNEPKKTIPDKEKTDAQRLAEQKAQRLEKIDEYSREVIEANKKAELEIRQAEISAMNDGFDKTSKQIELNYDRLIHENEKRAADMIDELKDKKTLEWLNRNPKATKEQEFAYRASIKVTTDDLSPQQKKILQEYEKLAQAAKVQANRQALDIMLKDIRTYEQTRQDIAREFDKKRADLFRKDANGNMSDELKEGITQDNVNELERLRNEAIDRVDEEFAQREDTFQAWCNKIASFTLEQLENVLHEAEHELSMLESTGGSGTKLAEARAKVKIAQDKVKRERASVDTPEKRTIKEWQDLYETLNECVQSFEDVGDAIGGAAGKAVSAAGTIATTTLSAINGIVQLVQMSSTAMTTSATTASAAVKTIEKASVILAVISSAIQIATTIANLFNDDEEKQKEIEHLQGRIDQLEWELNHADIVRLQEESGKAIDRVRKALSETYRELLKNKMAVNDYAGAWSLLFKKVQNNTELIEKTAKKLAEAYANIGYTADKALGGDKYKNAREQLENISKQQILIQQQIQEEEDKKKTNRGKIEEWEHKIEELGKEAVSIINDMVEDIIGGTSSDIASDLADAFFEAFQAGEDYAAAWGNKVNGIVADIMKRMLVNKFLEEPLGDIFDRYKKKWFKDGNFLGLDAVMDSMGGFASDLNAVGSYFAKIWENLPENVKGMFDVTDTSRKASEKGIATASQDSVDELNGRATAIQGHTFSIAENTKLLLSTVNLILQSVINIERHSETMSQELGDMRSDIKEMRDTINDISLNGVKLK